MAWRFIAIAAMQRRSILIAAGTGIGMAAMALGLLVGEPLLADRQISSDAQALAQAAKHQPTIDAALQQFLLRGPSGGAESDDRMLTQSSENLARYESARNLITGDMAALHGALEPGWLVAAAWNRRVALDVARQRTSTAIAALQHASVVLSAAIDQERLQQGFFYASVTEAKMLSAIDDQQYVQIDGLYAQANRALRVSETLMNKPDQPKGYKPVILAMRSVIDGTQKYAAALLRNDGATATTLHAAMRAGYASLAAATSDATVSANDDWNDRTYQPLIAAYHSGLAATLS